MTNSGVLKTVNWHLTPACNYSCRFCFVQNLHECPLPLNEGISLIKKLSDIGMEKINFAGGEPLLHPNLINYCKLARDLGMTVSVTTNGSLIDEHKIEEMNGFVDWIGLSVDSEREETEQNLCRGYGDHVSHSVKVAEIIHNNEIHLKINSTITKLNYKEDLLPLIRILNPERWKVFQMLDIRDENDLFRDLLPNDSEFRYFVQNHELFKLQNGNSPVFEYASDMERSYLMITPAGNVKIDFGKVIRKYSLNEVLEKGVDFFIDSEKYIFRRGIYK